MRTVFIGDVHGCARELLQLLRDVGFRGGADRLLLTGDAFSRGPDPVAVWDLIRESRAEMVLGNHDARLLEQLEAGAAGQTVEFRKPDQRTTFDSLEPAAPALLSWLRSVPLFIEEEDFLLVHAGINPEKGLSGTTRAEFLAIRTWPPSGGIEGPRWHDFIDPDQRPIVFGHDAPGGLVIEPSLGRGGTSTPRPHLIGLDSGCVYGGALSAYVLEENRVSQVQSQTKWTPRAPRRE